MKKILLLITLAAYSHISNAQSGEEVVSSNSDTTTITTKNDSIGEKLNRQEVELQALKKDNMLLKKQMKQVQSSFPNAKRKYTVSRTGSKQLMVEQAQ